jgi:hypothetical protein
MVRQAHHPEQRRRANPNNQNSKSQAQLFIDMMFDHRNIFVQLNIRSGFKIPDHAQRQGVDLIWKRSVHEVREHFKLNRNAVFGR